ncbi:MAG TPA: YfhO family protein, partial [Anaeromyxobacteraceae bacterium]|nr:YfhO family protein [Anaeromyxobacteraceae bacterium]
WLARVLMSDGGGEPCWSTSLAIGAPVLLLAAAVPGRDRRWLLAGSLGFVLLALGRHTPFYPLYRFLFPPEQLARYPEKYVYGALVLWSALAGAGFTELVERGGADRRLRLAAWSAGAALGAAVALVWLTRAPVSAWLAERAAAAGLALDPAEGLGLALRCGAMAAAGALIFALALQLRAARPTWRGAPLLAAAGGLLPLVLATWSSTPFAHREVVTRQPALLAAIPRPSASELAPLPRLLRAPQTAEQTRFDGGDDLAASFEETLSTDVPARFGVAALPGFDPASSPRFDRLWAVIFQRMSWEGLTGLLGVDYVAVEEAMAPQIGLAPAGPSVRGWSLLQVQARRPRAFVAPRWRVAPTADAALADLATPGRENDLGTVTLLADDAPPGPASPWPLSPCQVERRSPEELLLRCDSQSGGVAVLLEELAPGWRAQVDGRDAPILLADGLFRAAAIGPGPHEVRFHYRTPGLRAGAAISLAAWLALVILLSRGEGAKDRDREDDQ